jgi:predicted nucleic acid-binding protein
VSIVIDASLTMTWYFEDESTPATEALLDRVSDAGAVVPVLWRLEVANAFQMAIRRKRVDVTYRDASLADLAMMPIVIDAETNIHVWSNTLRLSDQFALTMYDASYLELAQRRNLPLATLDRDLRDAATAIGMVTLGA